MNERHTPPRIATRILERVLSHEVGESFLGDLEERFHVIAAERGVAAARWWYWTQTLRAPVTARRSHFVAGVGPAGDGTMHNLWADVRLAARVLRRDARFTALTVITLALGIGAATAMYSIVDGVLLRPLPYADAGRLVALRDVQRTEVTGNSFPEYVDWKRGMPSAFADIGAWFSTGSTLTGDGDPEGLVGDRITANMPALLGVRPIRGRTFRSDEESPSAERVVMISERLWRNRYASDSNIVGRSITMSGRPFTVVGVFPSSQRAYTPTALARSRPADFWMPLRLDETITPRSLHFMDAMGKLRDGVTLDAARAQMASLSARLRHDSITTDDIRVLPLAERVVGDSALLLQLLLGAVVMLLLIACANIANLLLARGAARQREFAIRRALGASRTRIVSQLLAENVARALLGGALGVAIAFAVHGVARQWLSLELPRIGQVAIDARVLAMAFVASVVTGIVFGLVPALRAGASDVNNVIRDGGRGVFGRIRGQRMRRTLIVGEMAMSFVLLVGAGLLLRSFAALANVNTGFDEARVVTSFLALPGSRYPDSTASRLFYSRLAERLAAVPGVEGVAFASDLPVQGGTSGGVVLEGSTPTPGVAGPVAEKRIVSSNYLAFMGARVVAGRLFDASDRSGAAVPAVVINETFAQRWFAGENPVGRRVDFAFDTQGLQTIVGVVADLVESPQQDGARAAIYIPIEQRANAAMYMLVRTAADPVPLLPAIRAGLREVDPLLAMPAPQTLSTVVASGIARQRATTAILSSFAALALILASVGLYGVISYSVTQRRQELGIRAALGARPGALMGLVLRQGAVFVVAGVVLGLGGALVLRQYIAAQLYETSPSDVTTYVLVTLVLVIVALAAMALPARRATKTDPLTALRAD